MGPWMKGVKENQNQLESVFTASFISLFPSSFNVSVPFFSSLSRLHNPPPQSNWFKSASWGGYSVGMCAFCACLCFHLSVNLDAGGKSLDLDCNSVHRKLCRGIIHQNYSAYNAKKEKKKRNSVSKLSVC